MGLGPACEGSWRRPSGQAGLGALGLRLGLDAALRCSPSWAQPRSVEAAQGAWSSRPVERGGAGPGRPVNEGASGKQRRNDTAATDGFRRGDGGRRRGWARLTTGMGGSGPWAPDLTGCGQGRRGRHRSGRRNGGGRELRRTPCGGATKLEDLRDTGRERSVRER